MRKRIPLHEGFTLKALVSADAPKMYRLIDSQRAYLGEWLPFIQFTNKVDDSRGFIEMAIESRKNNKDFVYKICHDDRLIGLIGTKETDYINKSTEIGYWLAQEYQSQGIMTNAVKNLIHELFDTMKIQRIQICCATGNDKSIAIPKRLGFKQEGIKRNGEWIGNYEFRDLIVFSLLKTDAPS